MGVVPRRHGGTRSTARTTAQHGSRCDMRHFLMGQHPADPDLQAIRNSSREEPTTPTSPTVRAEALAAIRRTVAVSRRNVAPRGAAAAAASGSEDAYANLPPRQITVVPRQGGRSKRRDAATIATFVRSLERHKFEEVEDGEQCSICIEEWETAEVAVMLPCRHRFHSDCIGAWLLKSSLCPICKLDSLMLDSQGQEQEK